MRKNKMYRNDEGIKQSGKLKKECRGERKCIERKKGKSEEHILDIK
jgi:hypothetical protein